MKKLALAVALLALAGCKQDAPTTVTPTVPNTVAPQVSKPVPIKKPKKVASSCDTERYYFESNALRINERPIKVITHKSVAELTKAYAATHGGRTLGSDEELFGFTVIGEKQCTIHIIDPAVRYCPSEFGHEMTHCLYGQFHSSQDETN